MHLPLLCSHPSLTITTLVMLVGRVEDPGFPQGETQLCFLHSALCRSLETRSWGLQPPSQWWLPISWRRVKISPKLRWEFSFSTCLNINPQVNIVERERGGGIQRIPVFYGAVSGGYAQTTAESLSHVEPATLQGSNICKTVVSGIHEVSPLLENSMLFTHNHSWFFYSRPEQQKIMTKSISQPKRRILKLILQLHGSFIVMV